MPWPIHRFDSHDCGSVWHLDVWLGSGERWRLGGVVSSDGPVIGLNAGDNQYPGRYVVAEEV